MDFVKANEERRKVISLTVNSLILWRDSTETGLPRIEPFIIYFNSSVG